MSVAYGVGLGLWFDAELGIDDAAVGAIPVAVLGLAAPIGVYFLDQPALPRGIPAAMSAGLFVGAGEGIGIATTQMARSDDAWGFRGLSRATVIGSTLGLAGGTALGFAYEPSPYSSLLVGSSVVWGSAIGSMFGLGASDGRGFSQHNDRMSLGVLIGYNVGLASSVGVTVLGYEPSANSLAWMWAGAGIGAAASLPVFLFYIGEDQPPFRRGLIFTGTATTLGIAAAALFTMNDGGDRAANDDGGVINLSGFGPSPVRDTIGLSAWGTLR
jgi:hypothetical protein